jgi:ketosteroid isomerase-like protein
MALPVIDRLKDAINTHDIDALTGCFALDFVCTWPAHPSRSFTGRDQVRRNWEMMFQARPDIQAAVNAHVRADDETWAEWEFLGTERDGSRFDQRGVIIVVVEGDVITEARFYMEPVDVPSAQ